MTLLIVNLLTWVSICALFDRRETFHETFNDSQSLITGFGRGLRAKARLQGSLSDKEQDRLESLRWSTLSYLAKRLEVIRPVCRNDGVAIAQLATAYTQEGLVRK